MVAVNFTSLTLPVSMGEHRNSKRSHANALGAKIRELTEDGDELMRIMFAIARDEDAPVSDRRGAVEWLADRGFGKSPIVVEHDVQHHLPLVDVSQLSLAEFRQMEATLAKMPPAGVEPELAGVDRDFIEVESEDEGDE